MRARTVSRAVAGLVAALLFLLALLGGCRKSEPPDKSSRVTFRTQDGFLLEGTVFGSGERGVILAHAFTADQSSWFDFAGELAAIGYNVLAFNFRGYGKSQGDRDIGVIDRDVVAAIDFMVTQSDAPKGVVVVGASMGGTASLIAATKSSSVKAIVTLSAPVEFMGLDASGLHWAPMTQKLIIAAQDDPNGAAGAAGELYRDSAPAAEIEIISGSEHGTEILVGPKGRKVRDLILSFMRKTLG